MLPTSRYLGSSWSDSIFEGIFELSIPILPLRHPLNVSLHYFLWFLEMLPTLWYLGSGWLCVKFEGIFGLSVQNLPQEVCRMGNISLLNVSSVFWWCVLNKKIAMYRHNTYLQTASHSCLYTFSSKVHMYKHHHTLTESKILSNLQ